VDEGKVWKQMRAEVSKQELLESAGSSCSALHSTHAEINAMIIVDSNSLICFFCFEIGIVFASCLYKQ